MPWINEKEYQYTSGLLRKIAASYDHIYSGIIMREWTERERRVSNPWEIAEYKADFDLSLSAIGRGQWHGITGSKISGYKNFGVLQRMVISDILGIPDEELMGLGFYNVPRLKGYAYYLMANYLNSPHCGIIK